MTHQIQYDRQIPLILCGRTVAEEVNATIFVDLDINDEPFVSEIWLEDMAPGGKGHLRLHSTHFPMSEEWWLWNATQPEAWEAVSGDVADDVLEAA